MQADTKVGNPIIPATGEKILLQADYTGTGPNALSLERSFRSSWASSAPSPVVNAGLGQAWSHNHAVSLVQQGAPGSAGATAKILFGNGTVRNFNWDTTSNSFKPSNSADTLTQGSGGLLYKRVDDDAALQFDAAGKLITLTQRNGWLNTYSYNSTGQLIAVSNQFGRSISFAYNAQGQLTSASTPDGQTLGYQHDSAGRLSLVTAPGSTASGRVSKSYVYENGAFPLLLTGIIDEAGNRYESLAYDSQGRGISTELAGGANRYAISYANAAAGGISAATVTDPLGTQRTYNYGSSFGKLAVTGADKPSGNFGSGGSDAASRVQDSVTGLVTQETDFLGINTMLTWDINRRLPLSKTAAAGRPEAQTVSTQWHPTFMLPVLVTEAGRTTASSYDSRGNLLTQSITDTATNQVRTWAWTYASASSSLNLVETMTEPTGGVWRYAYDSQGMRTSSTNSLGHVTSYLYDSAGRTTRMTEPNGLQTTYAYDPRGRLTLQTRGLEATSYSYHPTGQLASATLPNGYQVSYGYDAAQRLIAAQDNRGALVQYTLDAMGNRVNEAVKDPLGNIALTSGRIINSLNRVSAIQGSVGQTTQLSYDANGEPVQSTDPLNQTTRQTLDGLRRPVATTFADNAQASSTYNALNQLTQAVDPKAVATVYVKNAWGEVLTETSPDSGTTQNTRDASGNALTRTDARGNTTQYRYDSAGRVTQITQADGKLQLFSYDGTAAGNQVGYLRDMTDTSGTTRYERDAFGRITKKTQVVLDNATAPTTLITRYAYTSAGDVASIRYPSGLQVNYARSTTGQISGITTQAPSTAAVNPNPQRPFISALTHTALQQPQAWQWTGMGTSNTAVISTASRSFDADGRMTANQVASYTYDAASRIISIQQNLLAQRTITTASGTTTTSALQNYSTPAAWQVGYDSRNRVVSFTRTDSGNTSGAGATYTYDPNSNRLTAVNQTTTDTDKDGLFEANEQRKTTAQTLNLASDSNKLLGFTQVLTTVTGTRTNAVVNSQVNYTLDAAGNLLSDGLRSFTYDTTNRLSTVTLGSTFVGSDTIAGNELASQSYLHNALGQRVFKSEPRTALVTPDSTTLGPDFVAWLKNNFKWLWATAQSNATLGDSYNYGEPSAQLPSWALLGEYGNGSASGTGRTEYIWLPTEDANTGGSVGGGGAIPVGMYRGSKFYAIHTDHLGTPRLITDNTNAPVWQWAYSAFGDNAPTGVLKPTTNAANAYLSIAATAGSGTTTTTSTLLAVSNPTQVFNLRFPGQFADTETGNFYNYFRNYQPNQGRYTQGDPIGLSGGINRFGYVGGNALGFSDPLGLAPGPVSPNIGGTPNSRGPTTCSGNDCITPPFDLPPSSPKKDPKEYSCADKTTSLGACVACCAARSPAQYSKQQGSTCSEQCYRKAGITFLPIPDPQVCVAGE